VIEGEETRIVSVERR